MIRVYLGGEGANELGREGKHPGLIETLLRRVQQDGWVVVGRCCWRDIRKLDVGGATRGERVSIQRLAFAAKRARADALAFVRDADGDLLRTSAIQATVDEIQSSPPSVIGGPAFPVLEAWILAMLGKHGTEKLRKAAAQSKLEEEGIPPKNTEAMVAIAEKVGLAEVPADAASLHAWLRLAARVLPPLVASNAGRRRSGLP